MSDKKRRFFVEDGGLGPVYAGDTPEEVAQYITYAIQNSDLDYWGEESYHITSSMLTDEEVEALPDL